MAAVLREVAAGLESFGQDGPSCKHNDHDANTAFMDGHFPKGIPHRAVRLLSWQ